MQHGRPQEFLQREQSPESLPFPSLLSPPFQSSHVHPALNYTGALNQAKRAGSVNSTSRVLADPQLQNI